MKILGYNFNLNITPSMKDTPKSKLIPTDKDLIMKIVNSFADRSRKDIDKWRTAILVAENQEKPRRNVLQDLYKDLKTDGHFKAQIRMRKYATLNTEFGIVDKNGKPNEEATLLVNQKWFFQFLAYALDAIVYGHTLIEFQEFIDHKIKIDLVPRRNVVPELKQLIPDLGNDDFIDYSGDDFKDWVIEIEDDEDNFGIMNDIVPNLIWKRNVAQSWAEFCEKFGMPMVTAHTNTRDSKEIDKIEFMLQQLGEASTGVFPTGTTVDIKEASRTDAYQTYDNFIKFNKEEISVAIVGGTMLTNDGSSRSQSEVHERNLDKKIAQADKRFISFLVNDVLLPLLVNQGYSFIKEDDKFQFNLSHGLALDKFWKITQGIMKEYEVDDDWLGKTFHVTIAGKKKPNPQIN